MRPPTLRRRWRMSDDVKRLREWWDLAMRPVMADDQEIASAIARSEILKTFPALLDEVEAVRAVSDGEVRVGSWEVYWNAMGDGWMCFHPNGHGHLRDSDGKVRRFPTLPAALMAIRGSKP